MRARLVVFPIRGRKWCFSRSIDSSASNLVSSQTPSTFKDLYSQFSKSSSKSNANLELVIDFIANKMNRAWTALEKAPEGTFKNKIHGVGLRLLSRVKPSEIFLKSITKEVTDVEITYPSSLNARFVRRRVRHVALRGTIIHKNYFYGSVSLLPLTAAFSVLPLPNIPFFWILFRAYSHWRALKGSEKLLQLVSDSSYTANSSGCGNETKHENSEQEIYKSLCSSWVLEPSKELEEFLNRAKGNDGDGLSISAILEICKTFELEKNGVLKYRS